MLALSPHPATPCAAVRRILVEAVRPAAAALSLRYRIEGDLAAIRFPAWTPARRADELWKTTCLEAFVGVEGEAGYVEINLSPSNQWAAYGFDGYRQGMTSLEGVERRDQVAGPVGKAYELSATLDLGRTGLAGRDWRLGLSAVIETLDGVKSYWALAHPPGKPDFHHLAAFSARLPSVEPS